MYPGSKFGHLIVIRAADRSVVCTCICQRTVRTTAGALETGAVTSCGCRGLLPSFYTAGQIHQRLRSGRKHVYRKKESRGG
jgi:hypothetical protein